MQTVPQSLLALLQQVAPPEAKIVPLSWAFEQEDHNIAVVMPDTTDRLAMRQIEEALLDIVLDWDMVYHTFTVCKVWAVQDVPSL